MGGVRVDVPALLCIRSMGMISVVLIARLMSYRSNNPVWYILYVMICMPWHHTSHLGIRYTNIHNIQ